MRQQAIGFRAGKLPLEGVLTLPTGASGPFPGVALCHPHPMFGGNMDSAIVQALCAALNDRGAATLRFNFRGVGSSEGGFDRGELEQDDLRAAVDTLRRWPGIDGKRIGVAGASFGAVVALEAARRLKAVGALAALAPTIGGVRRAKLSGFKGQKLIVVGDRDLLVPHEELAGLVAEMPPPTEWEVMAGADHTFTGFETAAAERAARFMAGVLG